MSDAGDPRGIGAPGRVGWSTIRWQRDGSVYLAFLVLGVVLGLA